MTFNALSVEDTARTLADLLPDGLAWDAKNNVDTNLNKLLRGIATEFVSVQDLLLDIASSYIPTDENLARGTFTLDWLRSYLIPDQCLESLSDVSEAILYLSTKIDRSIILSSAQSYIDYAARFNADLEIVYLGLNDIKLILTPVSGPEFPYIFPIPFSSLNERLLKCVFEKSVPAHVRLVIEVNL